MSIISQQAQARQQLARGLPHRDLMEVVTVALPTGEDEHGNPIDGGESIPVYGAALPCLAIRLSSDDAVRAGLGDVKNVWRVVCNYPNAVNPSQNLRITRASGEMLHLAVLRATGTDITVVEGQQT